MFLNNISVIFIPQKIFDLSFLINLSYNPERAARRVQEPELIVHLHLFKVESKTYASECVGDKFKIAFFALYGCAMSCFRSHAGMKRNAVDNLTSQPMKY